MLANTLQCELLHASDDLQECWRLPVAKQQEHESAEGSGEKMMVKKGPAVSSKLKKSFLLVVQSDLLAETLASAQTPAQKPGPCLQIYCTVRAFASSVTAFHPFCNLDFKSKKKQNHSSSVKSKHKQSPSEPLQEGHRALNLQLCADTCTTKFRGSQHQREAQSSNLTEVLG